MSPMKVLNNYFGKKQDQSLQDFSNEIKALKESCPAESTAKSLSYKDFVDGVAVLLGTTVVWA